jgi:hypothetical protein
MMNIPETPSETPRQLTVRQRVSRCFTVLMLGNAIIFIGYRFTVWHTEWTIGRLGGQTVTGPPPGYSDLAYSTKTPGSIRVVLCSPFGRWLGSQFRVIYAVDLRRVSDPDAISKALGVSAGHKHVREIVLYKSAVQDEHLSIIANAFPGLRSLKINETIVGDSGIAQLLRHKTLTHLNVQRTAVTDMSVSSFCTMPRLKELNIGETSITSIEDLRRANPCCIITTELTTLKRTSDKQRTSRRIVMPENHGVPQ